MDHSVRGMELESGSVNIGQWEEVECLLYTTKSLYQGRYNPDVHPISRNLPWSHQSLYVNRFYVENGVETDIKITNCCGYISAV